MNAINSSFDDDLLILTFGELGMSEIEIKKGDTWVNKLDEANTVTLETVGAFSVTGSSTKDGSYMASISDFLHYFKPMPKFDMGSKQDKTITTLACLACGSQFPIDSAQAVAMGQGEGCPTCQLELIAENCSPSRFSEIIRGKLHLSFDKKVLPVLGAMPYMPAQASIAIDSSMGTVNVAVCPSCSHEYPIKSDGSYEISKKGQCYRCQLGRSNAGKMRLIGIAGQARSGKDTLASYLLNNLSNDWTRSSFADPIKNMLNVIGVDCSDNAKAVIDDSYGVTPRHMMQTLGTEWGRTLIDNDIWVKAFARLNAGMCVIVPDVRFDNEADLVRQHGVLIHLTGRGGIEGNHVSENPIGFKEGDIVIDNSRDLAWLYAQVDSNAVLSDFVDAE